MDKHKRDGREKAGRKKIEKNSKIEVESKITN
jgi:hypothetical protein